MEDILAELDREQSHVRVRVEERRYRKPSTIIEGLNLGESELEDVCKAMKRKLATGGTVKGGVIILQGDKREDVPRALQQNGFVNSSIDVL